MVMDVQDWNSIDIEKAILGEVDCEILSLSFPNDDQVMEAIRDADALLPRYIEIGARHIEAMDRCRVIARSGIGVDIVDVDAATAKGIWVTNVPSYCEEEVADHAAALILASVRKLAEYQESVRQGEWSWRTGRPIISLCQAVFGLVGFGKIGRLVWRRMKAFGCQGLIYDPYADPDAIREDGGTPASLDDLLARADVVHIQCPLTPETRHLIDERAINLMKPGAIVTNAARGPIIDENALITALQNKRIAGAGLDDIENEPAKVKDWHPSPKSVNQYAQRNCDASHRMVFRTGRRNGQTGICVGSGEGPVRGKPHVSSKPSKPVGRYANEKGLIR